MNSTDVRLREKRLALLKWLIDNGWEPEIGWNGEWHEGDLRDIGYAELRRTPQRHADPLRWCVYTGPKPIYDTDTCTLLKKGSMIGDPD